jgi:predicted XRE-type DNA-binding protein
LKLGLSQPRLSDLMNGHIDKFSLDMLINLAKQAGLTVKIEFLEAA